MITRQTKIQLLVFAVIALFGLTYTGAKYAGLSKYFVNEGYVVSADFADSGGIFKGAEVTYRGVTVGKVDQLRLIDQGVRVDLKLKTGTEVPQGGRAVVANRSAVGEQFVDLQPRSGGAPYMRQGDTIPLADTEIPIQPTQLLVNLDRFVNSVSTQDVATVLDELGTAFEGRGQDLQRLVDAGDLLTKAATANLPQTLKLINDGKTVLDTQRATSNQFKSFNRDLRALSDTLRSSDPDFRRLFANGTDSAVAATDLVESNRSDLPVLLSNLITTAQVQKVRIPAIRQILVTYPNVIAGGFTVTPPKGDATAHFGQVSSMEPGVCGKAKSGEAAGTKDGTGYSTPRSPSETSIRTPDLSAYCGQPEPVGVRGAQHAPRPGGLAPFGGGADQAGGSGSSSASTRSGSSASSTSSSNVLGDYDPTTGRTITSDGRSLTIGSTAGAAQVFGSSSWQWLLARPLSRS